MKTSLLTIFTIALAEILETIANLTVLSVSTYDCSYGGDNSEYGRLKAKLFEGISFHNRFLLCRVCSFNCVSRGCNRQRLDYSARFLRVMWLSQLLNSSQVQRILYVDHDALFIIPDCTLERIFDAPVLSQPHMQQSADLAPCDRLPSWSLAGTLDIDSRGESIQRIQTGVLFIRNTPSSREIIDRLWRSRQVRQSVVNKTDQHIGFVSDQHALGRVLASNPHLGSQACVLPKAVFNAFPAVNNTIWTILRLPQGDELPSTYGKTKIVHFAGVFGGASIESGQPDLTITLLSLTEAIDRSILFVKNVITLERCKISSHLNETIRCPSHLQSSLQSLPRIRQSSIFIRRISSSLLVLTSLSNQMRSCAQRVFRMFDIVQAEQFASNCLRDAIFETRKLAIGSRVSSIYK